MENTFKFEIPESLTSSSTEWVVAFASHYNFKLKTRVAESQETGRGILDLMDHLLYAFEHGIEFEVSFDIDPTPRFLYDNTGGEPAVSADERWQNAFDQKRRLSA